MVHFLLVVAWDAHFLVTCDTPAFEKFGHCTVSRGRVSVVESFPPSCLYFRALSLQYCFILALLPLEIPRVSP